MIFRTGSLVEGEATAGVDRGLRAGAPGPPASADQAAPPERVLPAPAPATGGSPADLRTDLPPPGYRLGCLSGGVASFFCFVYV